LAVHSSIATTYPTTPALRESYRTPNTNKRVSPHHWAVYDATLLIPSGKVTTYKALSIQIGAGSPRSVGGALRNNPFAPWVPCHRVVATDLFVGGFKGEWKGRSREGKE
ncbi:6-O-methylguanine DNA methyltransferase, partial [Amylostereum chailletii]